LTKQYQKLLEYENCELRFSDGALREIAREAIKRNTGARGLRSVIENAMLDVMYEIPSKGNVKECIIDEGVILKSEKPKLVYRTEREMAQMAKSSSDSAESA
jgi:ATP-dependent Clp protease ATP-binding subunit ClpX